jgi:membrane associated rhomboid family serine protease
VIPLRDENPTSRFAVVTLLLILANVGVFWLIQRPAQVAGEDVRFTYEYAAIPCELTTREPLSIEEIEFDRCVDDDRGQQVFPGKQVWLAAVTSMFLHAGLLHLGGNMLFLWVFGNNVEDELGPLPYAAFYLAGGVVATVAHVMVDAGSTIPVVGASGAVAGVMGANHVWLPRAPILTFLPPFFVFDITARWLLLFWFVLQFFTGPDTGVAWAAHVGGFVFGAVIGVGLLPHVRRARRGRLRRRRGPGPGGDRWLS